MLLKINNKVNYAGDKRKQDLPVILKRNWPFILAILIIIITRLALHYPEKTERWYSDGLYPVIASVLSSVSRLIPFSLWDVFWAVMILIFTAGFILVFSGKVRSRVFLIRLSKILAVMISWFYISWGFNYFRPALNERMGFELINVDEAQFREGIDTVISRLNRSYCRITHEDYPAIDSSVERSYARNASLAEIGYPGGYRRPKSMIFGSLIAKFGISGYFGPFFNEINLNKKILPMEYPFLLAHEKAHQFGVAGEADANMVAFLICTLSDDPGLYYSGYLCLLLYFLEDAQHLDEYADILGKLDKKILSELRFRQQYYYGIQNESMEKAHEVVYDAYLKGNSVPGGIENYNQVVELAISWFADDSAAGM